MASTTQSILLQGLHGSIGKEVVIKQYGKKTVVSRYPDMSNIQPSALQQQKRILFREAVAYAKSILNNPVQKKLYQAKIKKGQTVYHYALKAYLLKHSKE